MSEYSIDEALNDRIRKRIGRDSAVVDIREESWNEGMCETCDWPTSGFAVYADNKLVWPSEDYLENFGGYIYADESGEVYGNNLSTYGEFDRWLQNDGWDGIE